MGKVLRGMPLRFLWLILALAFSAPAAARGDVPQAQTQSPQTQVQENKQQIRVAELPQEARETLQLIRRGGPYPHDRDGVTFGNYEKLLPAAPRGHYREYTVMTPGVRHRGARRIVVGCERQRAASASPSPGALRLVHCRDGGEFYYTADHYRSFRRIVE
jgi:ribonuclease T1